MPAVPPKSIVLIISGPAGSGKTTLCDRLTENYAGQIERFVTTTTRAPRPGEKDGVDYHFLSREAFEEGIGEGAFYEWAEVHGNLYGTERRRVHERLRAERDLLLNIDVQGAEAFRQAGHVDPLLEGRVVTVFIKPASIEQLQTRLHSRGTDDPETILRRIKTAQSEISASDRFDHCIITGSMEEDFRALEAIYKSTRQQAAH